MDAVANDAGCTRGTVQKMEDPEDIGHPVHADLLMTPALAKHAIRILARDNGMVAVELPANASDAATVQELARVAKETSDVVNRGLLAVADGYVDTRERVDLIREGREAIEAIAALIQRLEADRDQPVVRVLGGAK
jgi:hypothetical protein